MKTDKGVVLLALGGIILAILGSTFAYWSWSSNNAQKTNVTFTMNSTFSCSATGGGNISNTNTLAPTSCTNSTYAIKRTITTSITNTGSDTVYLDMWLKINSIGSGLTGTSNFKYALTTNSSSCTSDIVRSGNFYNKQANDRINLLDGVTSATTYYLYIWLDSAETNSSTYNQNVSLSLEGECNNEEPSYVYTTNIYESGNEANTVITMGQAIPAAIDQYDTPEGAMAAYVEASGGALSSFPVFLRHRIQNNVVTESYLGFVLTQNDANNYSGVTAGTYYLRGLDVWNSQSNTCKREYSTGAGDDDCLSPYHYENGNILLNAFGSSYYGEDAFVLYSEISNLNVVSYMDGNVYADNGSPDSYCKVFGNGEAYCILDAVYGTN